MKLPKIYKKFYEQQVFTLEQAVIFIKNKRNTLKQISHLIKKSYIKRIKNGLYYIIPVEYIGKKFTFSNKYQIASLFEKKYFLSYHTALEMHGIAHSSFFKAFISSNKQPKTFVFEGFTYKKVYTSDFWGIEEKKLAFGTVYISDIERTFIDCINRIDYCSGLEELLKSFEAMPIKLDFNKVLKYLKKYHKKNLYAKTGFILELLDDVFHTPEETFQKLKKLVGTHVYYLERKQGCKYDKNWNLMVSKNINELMKSA